MDGSEFARIAAIESRAYSNAVRIDELVECVEGIAATRVETWDFHTLRDEVEEMRCILRRLKNLVDEAEEGMFDTEQFFGDLRDLLA